MPTPNVFDPTREKRLADRQAALDLIEALMPDHGAKFIAKALEKACVPVLSGRPGAPWRHQRVSELLREIRAKKVA
jgi:hypothetical protein